METMVPVPACAGVPGDVVGTVVGHKWGSGYGQLQVQAIGHIVCREKKNKRRRRRKKFRDIMIKCTTKLKRAFSR